MDLRPIVEPSLENYYDFFHATPAGARTVASAVAAAIVREQPLTGATEVSVPKRAS
jgi:hypothetical protein